MENCTNCTKKELFLEAYENTLGNISKACKSINIARRNYYYWIEKSTKFKQAIDEIDESFIDLAECALRKNVKKGVQKAIEFLLTNRKKDKYSNTVRNELTGKDGEPVNVNFIIKMGDKCLI